MKGSDVMLVGSYILIILLVTTPKSRILTVVIPFLIFEVLLALLVTFRNYKQRENRKEFKQEVVKY